MPYLTTATAIIKQSIRSAVFIDEKALEPYAMKSDAPIREETLSIELMDNFKKSNISLAVHKFKNADPENLNIKNYLFENRDLVLLDWKLNGEEGEDYSLKLLADVVKRPHIHFCCIYTSEPDITNVFYNLLSYFSNTTDEEYEDIRLDLADLEEDVKKIMPQLKKINVERHEASAGQEIGKLMKTHGQLVSEIKNRLDISDTKCALIKTSIAFDNKNKSKEPQPCPEIVSFDRQVMVIENTIVTILNKDSSNATELIEKLSQQIATSKNSFTQLLGLEIQNIFSKKGAFLDSNMLTVSKESLLFHRKQLLEEEDGIDLPFKDFMKELLLEHSKSNIGTKDITLLNDEFLNLLSVDINEPQEDEMVQMNVFYNSTKLKDNEQISFGDVFKSANKYYVCITSLCDCLRPKKIGHAFYFAIGENINKTTALKLGDTAFVNYLSKSQIVRWSAVESDVDAEQRKFKPIYIKPELFIIPDYKLNNEGKIFLNQLNERGENIRTEVQYVTTIRTNYAQRIANHAFAYPVRVGIDFVKKK